MSRSRHCILFSMWNQDPARVFLSLWLPLLNLSGSAPPPPAPASTPLTAFSPTFALAALPRFNFFFFVLYGEIWLFLCRFCFWFSIIVVLLWNWGWETDREKSGDFSFVLFQRDSCVLFLLPLVWLLGICVGRKGDVSLNLVFLFSPVRLGEVWNGTESWDFSSLGFYGLGSDYSETPNLFEPNNSAWLCCFRR